MMKILSIDGKSFLFFKNKIVNVDHIQGFILDVKTQEGEGFTIQSSTGKEFILYKDVSPYHLLPQCLCFFELVFASIQASCFRLLHGLPPMRE